jgi:hypothetical protein
MTVNEAIEALSKVRDEHGGEVHLTAYAPGDPSVGIWEYNAEVKSIHAYTEYDDETGERTDTSFAVVTLQD